MSNIMSNFWVAMFLSQLHLLPDGCLTKADRPRRLSPMSQLQPYTPLLPTTRVTRTLTRLSTDTTISTAVIQANAEVEAAKVDGVSAVAAKAMQDVALLSQMEQSLAHAVPHASGRLATVADLAAISIAGVVADAASRIGR